MIFSPLTLNALLSPSQTINPEVPKLCAAEADLARMAALSLHGAAILDSVTSYTIQDGGAQDCWENEATANEGLCDHRKSVNH